MTKLLRIEKSTYTDQYGFEHPCWEVVEEVEVEPTNTHYTYEYYSETIKNPYYQSEDGRLWLCMIPTDYGGSSSWTRRVLGQRVADENWVQDRGYPTYGLHPLIRKETT